MSHSFKKVWNVVSTVLVALVVLLAVALVGVRLVGLNTYVVLSGSMDKTTPRLIQFHTLKNAVNPPFLGGFSIFNTVVA